MANTIRLHPEDQNVDEWLSMSNGGTDAFLTALVLSGSRLVKNDREKEFVVWLAEHDQAVVGMGTVGFDISEMPWTVANFEAEKEFIVKCIDGALARIGWETLDYQPNEDFVFKYLSEFKNLILQFQKNQIDIRNYHEWIELKDDPACGIPKGFPKCPKHDTYLHFGGCIVCNNQVLD
jgi:hypothetical protein